MAPRRSSSGSSVYGTVSCSDAYITPYSRAVLAYNVLFLVFFTGIFISTFFIRRRSGVGKKLIGVPFVIALFLQVISWLLSLVTSVMSECDSINYVDYLNVVAASRIMSSLADWMLLFVFVYVLNSMLLKQLGISGSKTVLLIVIGVMFAVTVADISLDSYVLLTNDFLGGGLALAAVVSQGLSLTLEILWMVSVIISAAVSLSNISALRSRSLPGGDLVGWVTALYVFLFVPATLGIVVSSSSYWPVILPSETYLVIAFISNLSIVLGYTALLGIAKHISWNQTITKTEQVYYEPVMQQQETYGYGNGQQDYYQQTPELVHAK